ncbi:hypothetical protein D8674_029104 [Pyrus ussuriensis x Pyrus communis]|uniref:Uncharacterized protein n=1 Tax=Pyrus ussuriensis x Pyrus communis TaxID=2448454 RepID=A0A5N5I151_9ROSA|nr:hypothetical protein D8674_029104 [Pyrus ussuriensis x Pyrus communis]
MCADNYNQLQEGDSSVSSKEDANAVVIPWQLLHPMRTQMLPTLTSAFDSAYLIKGTLSDGISFIAYTYAGELPSCAFGPNTRGLVRNGRNKLRNFVSRDLLEASSIKHTLCVKTHTVGHSYNLIDTKTRRILNVETASKQCVSFYEVGATPFFHAYMYLLITIQQLCKKHKNVQDEKSITRQSRVTAVLPGPLLHALCTAVIDLDEQTLSIMP